MRWPKEGVVEEEVNWNGLELQASLKFNPAFLHAGVPATLYQTGRQSYPKAELLFS